MEISVVKNAIVLQVSPAITSQASAAVHQATQAELVKNVSNGPNQCTQFSQLGNNLAYDFSNNRERINCNDFTINCRLVLKFIKPQ